MIGHVWLKFSLVAVAVGAAVPPQCQAALDNWCNSAANQDCYNAIKEEHYALPLHARLGHAKDRALTAWRCYSPSSLTPDLSHYSNGTAYCTRTQLTKIAASCVPDPNDVFVDATRVFTPAEVKSCGDIRTPQPLLLPSGEILLFAQCRTAPLTEPSLAKATATTTDTDITATTTDTDITATTTDTHITATTTDADITATTTDAHITATTTDADITDATSTPSMLGDSFLLCRMVMKRSADGGRTWGGMSFVSPRSTGVGVALYDAVTSTVVFQYQHFSLIDPYTNNRLLQLTSADDGRTWSEPRDLTAMLAGCNGGKGGMVCGAAGSRVATRAGRLVFAGHNNKQACVWYSDDHGKTYNTSQLFTGNEISVCQLDDESLLMNGRGTQFSWKNRTQYRSVDGGHTWSEGVASPLSDVNCEGALISGSTTSSSSSSTASPIYFSEPHGPGRVSLRISCSRDGGRTWPSYIEVNPGEVAAYSAMVQLPGGGLLAIWEQQPNQLAFVFPTDWCKA